MSAGGELQVRRARPGDEQAIAEVHVRTWQHAYRGLLPDALLDGLSVERRASMWAQIILEWAGSDTGASVLEVDRRVCGLAHTSASRDEDADATVGELTAIYVAPELWGMGGGRLLLEHALAGVRAAGYLEATLWVLDSNARARRFYESAGWVADGATKLDDFDGCELLELRYRLSLR